FRERLSARSGHAQAQQVPYLMEKCGRARSRTSARDSCLPGHKGVYLECVLRHAYVEALRLVASRYISLKKKLLFRPYEIGWVRTQGEKKVRVVGKCAIANDACAEAQEGFCRSTRPRSSET